MGRAIGLRCSCRAAPFNCPGCHNPQTHDFPADTSPTRTMLSRIWAKSAGARADALRRRADDAARTLYLIAKAAKEKGHERLVLHPGFTLELMQENRVDRMGLLSAVDVLVDGPFRSHERSLDLLYAAAKPAADRHARDAEERDDPALCAAGMVRACEKKKFTRLTLFLCGN